MFTAHSLTLFVLVLQTPTATAQTGAPSNADSSQSRAAAVAAAPPTRFSYSLARAFLIGSAALAPFDGRLHLAMRTHDARSPQASSVAATFNWIGGTGALVGSVGALMIGRVTHRPRLTRIGAHATEAIVISATLVAGLKGIAGRSRPYVAGDDADDFHLGRGFRGGRTSFPSGHTTAAFAAATVLRSELAPSSTAGAVMLDAALFGGASLVGLARMYDAKHWASDVSLGAGIGTITALYVERAARLRGDDRFARLLAGPSALAPGRMDVGVSVAFPRH